MQDIQIKSEVEEIYKDSNNIQKISIYDELLLKENNLYIKFPSDKKQKIKKSKSIPFKSSSSYLKICKLAKLRPEENIIFTLYELITKKDLKEKLHGNPHYGIKIKRNIQDDYKQSILTEIINNNKDDLLLGKINVIELISKNPKIYEKIWKSFYFLLLFFAAIILISLFYVILVYHFILVLPQIANYVQIFVLINVFYKANEKFKKKFFYDFDEENKFILISIGICAYSIFSCFLSIFSGSLYELMNNNSFKIFLVCFLLILTNCVLFVLNEKMTNFYDRYSYYEKEGSLLDDIEKNTKEEIIDKM